jgi:hypothetical protein
MMETETIDLLLEQFAWYEQHHDDMNATYVDKYKFLGQLKTAFNKECITLFVKDPSLFHELCGMSEFREQLELYGLCAYVDQILFGKHGQFLASHYKKDTGICYNQEYTVSWRGNLTCDVTFH